MKAHVPPFDTTEEPKTVENNNPTDPLSRAWSDAIDGTPPPEYFDKVTNNRADNRQVGGDHYKYYKIQPMEYALKNNLNFAQANIIKYVTRYKDKNGIQDLEKALHCIELLIDFEEGKNEINR